MPEYLLEKVYFRTLKKYKSMQILVLKACSNVGHLQSQIPGISIVAVFISCILDMWQGKLILIINYSLVIYSNAGNPVARE